MVSGTNGPGNLFGATSPMQAKFFTRQNAGRDSISVGLNDGARGMVEIVIKGPAGQEKIRGTVNTGTIKGVSDAIKDYIQSNGLSVSR